MTVRYQYGDRIQPVLSNSGLDSVKTLHTWVHDGAVRAWRSGNEVAICLQGAGRKRCEEHERQVTAGGAPAKNQLPLRLLSMSETANQPWGRVDEQGNVYLRTSAGERVIAQLVDLDPTIALDLYEKKYAGLVVEVELLEKRISSGKASPEHASEAVSALRESINTTHAIGDIDALLARIDALAPLIEEQREIRKAQKAERVEAARVTKARIAADAEQLAKGNDWKNGADRLRVMLDEWKALPHLDKKTDDELWHRFSSARTTYTKRRKAHFSELKVKQENAAKIKDGLVAQAEALATSTDFANTSTKFRELMNQWKAAGPAARPVENKLWERFRVAQETFFKARDEHNSMLDVEFSANAEIKDQILKEAEALLPIKDVEAVRPTWRKIMQRWDAAGKVPRDRIKEMEGRLRAVERAIKEASQAEWNRSNPELSARADSTVGKLQKAIDDLKADLAKAQAAGNDKKVKEIEESIKAREAWLEQAQKALAEFS